MQHINKTIFANLILITYFTDKQKLPFQQKDPVVEEQYSVYVYIVEEQDVLYSVHCTYIHWRETRGFVNCAVYMYTWQGNKRRLYCIYVYILEKQDVQCTCIHCRETIDTVQCLSIYYDNPITRMLPGNHPSLQPSASLRSTWVTELASVQVYNVKEHEVLHSVHIYTWQRNKRYYTM